MKRAIALILALGAIGFLVLRTQSPTPTTIEQHEPYRNPTQNGTQDNAQAPIVNSESDLGGSSKTQNEDPSPELKAEIEKTSAALPTIQSLKGMKEEDVAHRAPHQVIEAGAALGDLAEYLERHPSEFKNATAFYAKCALNESLLPAARALCLSTLRKKPNDWASGVKESIERVPEDIKGIAADLE